MSQTGRAASAAPPLAPSGVRPLVIRAFQEAAVAHERTTPPLEDGLLLLDSGLDSLCYAVIAARLESVLGLDPFTDLQDEDPTPLTVGEFVALYERAAGKARR